MTKVYRWCTAKVITFARPEEARQRAAGSRRRVSAQGQLPSLLQPGLQPQNVINAIRIGGCCSARGWRRRRQLGGRRSQRSAARQRSCGRRQAAGRWGTADVQAVQAGEELFGL